MPSSTSSSTSRRSYDYTDENGVRIRLIGAESEENARTRKFHWALFIICIILIIILALIIWLRRPYEFLLFSQNYTVSNCIISNASGKNCSAESLKYPWTIHGIWPSELEDYPSYCKKNEAFKFNESSLQPIKSKLDAHWPATDGDNENFWRHEWDKHGTCAVDQTPLDSQLKYFEQGLKWNQEFDIEKIFNASGIYPSDEKNYKFNDVQSALENGLGVTADISCYQDHKRNASILVEVRICFSTSLKLISCNDSVDKPCSEEIYYPATTNFHL